MELLSVLPRQMSLDSSSYDFCKGHNSARVAGLEKGTPQSHSGSLCCASHSLTSRFMKQISTVLDREQTRTAEFISSFTN